MNPTIDYKIVTGDAAIDVVVRMVASQRSRQEAKRQVELFLQFVNRYRIDISRQPVALLNGQLVGYALVLVSPGASASAFLPEKLPTADIELTPREIAGRVVKLLADQIETWDLGLIQTVIEDETSNSGKIFLAAGFTKLCDLEIMEASVSIDRCLAPNEQIEWIPFSPKTEHRFARTIVQSYQASRDCSVLNGLRTGEEILEGHRYSGIFEPKGWWLLRYEEKDAGVVLLNSTEEAPDRLELVYMGLSQWARGLGLGKALLSRAFESAGTLDKKIIRLAVDRQNIPAIALYRQFGLDQVARQSVLAVLNEARRKRLAENAE